MPKGDDYLQKKKTKAIRKRMRRVGADSLEAIQGVQAAKRRRKSGTRRACEGMCYTLPTPDDPYNERNNQKRRRKENAQLRKKAVPAGEILEFETYADILNDSDFDASAGYERQLKRRKVSKEDEEHSDEDAFQNVEKQIHKGKAATCSGKQGSSGDPSARSKELQVESLPALSLSKELKNANAAAIEELVHAAIRGAGLLREDFSNVNFMNGESKESTAEQGNTFGKQDWKRFTKGVDVVAVSSYSSEERALAYIISVAAHIKVERLKLSTPHKPLVLIIVSSQDQALQVRHACRALKKPLGIFSVALHSGTSLNRQTEGLNSRTPEIVVATPERLEELVTIQAISLSSVSLMVVDGLDEIVTECPEPESHLSKLKESVHQGAQKLIFSKQFSEAVVTITRQLVVDPIARVMCDSTIESKSACITQAVSVFTSANKRLPKMLKLLQQFWEKQKGNTISSILVLAENAVEVEELLHRIQGIGYSASGLSAPNDSELELSMKKLCDGSVQVLVTTEEFLGQLSLERMQLVISYSFPSTMRMYEQILTRMARESVHGVLHSFCTAAMACLARDLVQVLQTCKQEVPHSLRMLEDAVNLLQNGKQ